MAASEPSKSRTVADIMSRPVVPVAAVEAAATGTSASGTSADGADTTTTDSPHPVRAGIRQWWQDLSDEQQQCLQDADLRRPVGRLDDAERAAVRERVQAAADACGVELPFPRARAFRASLTDEQRQCLEDAGLTRPVGPMTTADRQELRQDLEAAAEGCGITLPERPAAVPGT